MRTGRPLKTTSHGPNTASNTVSKGRQTASWKAPARALTARSLSRRSMLPAVHGVTFGDVPVLERAGFVTTLEQRPFDLATAGALDRSGGGNDHFVHLKADAVDDAAANLGGKLTGRKPALGFHHHDHPFAGTDVTQSSYAEGHD